MRFESRQNDFYFLWAALRTWFKSSITIYTFLCAPAWRKTLWWWR